MPSNLAASDVPEPQQRQQFHEALHMDSYIYQQLLKQVILMLLLGIKQASPTVIIREADHTPLVELSAMATCKAIILRYSHIHQSCDSRFIEICDAPTTYGNDNNTHSPLRAL